MVSAARTDDAGAAGRLEPGRPPLTLTLPTGEHFEMRTSARSGDGVFRFRWTLAPGKRGPPVHTHPFETESFAIVSGTLRIWVTGAPRDLVAGDRLSVPPGVAHRFLNPGTVPVVVDVSCDGSLQEDSLVPSAVLQSSGQKLSLSTMLAGTIHQFHSGAIGAHPPFGRWLMTTLARLLVGLGVKRLPPVIGWDAPSARRG